MTMTASDFAGISRSPVRVFVIHSHKDKQIVSPLVQLLQRVFPLGPGAIRATSHPSAQLDLGSDVDATLKSDLRDAEVAIAVVTSASLQSPYVMGELETRRVAGGRIMPLVGPSVSSEQLPHHLQGLHAASLDGGIPSLIEGLGRELKSPVQKSWIRSHRSLIEQIIAAASRRYVATPVPKSFEELFAPLTSKSQQHAGKRWSKVVLTGTRLLHDLLKDGGENFQPDLMVALNQGGMVTAGLLKRWLAGPVGVAFTALSKSRDVLSLALPNPEDLHAMSTVLIVDSKLKTGQSVQNVMNAMNRLRPSQPFAFRLAVLVEYGKWEPPRWSFTNGVRWPATLNLREHAVPTYVAYRTISEDTADPFPEPWREDILMPGRE